MNLIVRHARFGLLVSTKLQQTFVVNKNKKVCCELASVFKGHTETIKPPADGVKAGAECLRGRWTRRVGTLQIYDRQ